jgi:hypothetical protein
MFHPVEADVFFICCPVETEQESGDLGFVVVKYEIAGSQTTAKVVCFATSSSAVILPFDESWPMRWPFLSWKQPGLGNVRYGTHPVVPGRTNETRTAPSLLCFSVYTESFHYCHHQAPDTPPGGLQGDLPGLADWQSAEACLVKSSRQTLTATIRRYGSYGTEAGSLITFADNRRLASWPASGAMSRSLPRHLTLRGDNCKYILSDSGFLVLVGDLSCYVWSFQDRRFLSAVAA